jgi:hypothetical protein
MAMQAQIPFQMAMPMPQLGQQVPRVAHGRMGLPCPDDYAKGGINGASWAFASSSNVLNSMGSELR